jgi:hypothetical protein
MVLAKFVDRPDKDGMVFNRFFISALLAVIVFVAPDVVLGATEFVPLPERKKLLS